MTLFCHVARSVPDSPKWGIKAPTKNNMGELALMGAVSHPSTVNEKTKGSKPMSINLLFKRPNLDNKEKMSSKVAGMPKFMAYANQLL